eukprot:gene6608-6346_t
MSHAFFFLANRSTMPRFATTVLGLAAAAQWVAHGVEMNGDTPWVVLGESEGIAVVGDSLEGDAYNMALRDLQMDWYKVGIITPPEGAHRGQVFGHPPPVQRYTNGSGLLPVSTLSL